MYSFCIPEATKIVHKTITLLPNFVEMDKSVNVTHDAQTLNV